MAFQVNLIHFTDNSTGNIFAYLWFVCKNYFMLYNADKCAIDMIETTTDKSVFSVIANRDSDNAKNSIAGSPGFSVPSTKDSDQVQLVLSIKSEPVALVNSIFFVVDGTKQVEYFLRDSKTNQRFPSDSESWITEENIVTRKFPSPVAANELTIITTAAAANSIVTVSNLLVEACIKPGAFLTIIMYHSLFSIISLYLSFVLPI